MSERRRSAAALSSRAHAFSVEALIGSNKKRKLRGWEEKELELSMESLAADGEDPAHCLDMDPGQCADMHPHRSARSRLKTRLREPTRERARSCALRDLCGNVVFLLPNLEFRERFCCSAATQNL